MKVTKENKKNVSRSKLFGIVINPKTEDIIDWKSMSSLGMENKLKKLNLSMSDLFLKQDKLINTQTQLLSDIKLDFSSQIEFLKQQFENLFELARQTDKSFLGAVAAQEKKQTKGLKNLEKRLLKAQKRKLSEQLNRIKTLQNELFPGCSLQERNTNFSEFYLAYGDQLIPQLVLNLQPLKGEFLILEL